MSGLRAGLRQVFEEASELPRRQQQRIVGVVEDMIAARKAAEASS